MMSGDVNKSTPLNNNNNNKFKYINYLESLIKKRGELNEKLNQVTRIGIKALNLLQIKITLGKPEAEINAIDEIANKAMNAQVEIIDQLFILDLKIERANEYLKNQSIKTVNK